MTYKATLDYMYSQLPMFHRIGPAAYKANLDNTFAICNLLNEPQNKFRSVHVAGTNGKGSTSHFLAAILQTAGYKTGLYTSPHLRDFRERIKINGKKISQKKVVEFIEKYKYDFERIKPSFFEMTVGMAFDYFSKEKVDVAVIETGLGGRLDSTNIITPLLSVITNISKDHTHLLGNTLQKIAEEKAGIIKRNIPIVVGETHQRTKDIFIRKAKELDAPLFFADKTFSLKQTKDKHVAKFQSFDVFKKNKIHYKNLQLDLTGYYQQKNILTVLQVVELLNQQGFQIQEEYLRTALQNTKKITGLLGRWQTLSTSPPLTICDVGHNEDGIKEVIKQISLTPHNQLHFVLGMVNDKDVTGILQLLPKDAVYYFCKANIPRALDENELSQQAKKTGLSGNIYPSVESAFRMAQQKAMNNDLVFVGGSTFVVAEIIPDN